MTTHTTAHKPGQWYRDYYSADPNTDHCDTGIFSMPEIDQPTRQIAILRLPTDAEPAWSQDYEANARLIPQAPAMRRLLDRHQALLNVLWDKGLAKTFLDAAAIKELNELPLETETVLKSIEG